MTLPFSCLYQGAPVVLPAPAPNPAATATTGGTIAASTVVTLYVSALVGSTETLATAATSVTTGSGTATNTATVTWYAIPGATSYNIYAKTGAGSIALVGSTTTALTFTWTGSAGTTAPPAQSGFALPVLYTVPANKTALLLGIVASNPTAYNAGLYLSRIPSGGTAQPIVSGTPVTPDVNGGQPADLTRKHALAAGDQLVGYLTVPGVTLTLDALVG